jgi:hypothetical protein
VQSFDPDEDVAYVEPESSEGVQLDEDVVAIDADRALALLDRITSDLPGGGENREGQRDMVRSVAAAFSRRTTTIIEARTGGDVRTPRRRVDRNKKPPRPVGE